MIVISCSQCWWFNLLLQFNYYFVLKLILKSVLWKSIEFSPHREQNHTELKSELVHEQLCWAGWTGKLPDFHSDALPTGLSHLFLQWKVWGHSGGRETDCLRVNKEKHAVKSPETFFSLLFFPYFIVAVVMWNRAKPGILACSVITLCSTDRAKKL